MLLFVDEIVELIEWTEKDGEEDVETPETASGTGSLGDAEK